MKLGDEMLENFWNSTSRNRNGSSIAVISTDNKINKLTEKVLAVGLGGATRTESRKCVNEGYSILVGASKSALIAANFVETISSATPNLII